MPSPAHLTGCALSVLTIVFIESFIPYHVPSIHSYSALSFLILIKSAQQFFISKIFKCMHTQFSGIVEWISHHIWQFLFCQFCLLRSVSMNLTWQCIFCWFFSFPSRFYYAFDLICLHIMCPLSARRTFKKERKKIIIKNDSQPHSKYKYALNCATLKVCVLNIL